MMQNGLLSVFVDQSGHVTFYRKGKQILSGLREGDIDARYRHVEGEHYRIKVAF